MGDEGAVGAGGGAVGGKMRKKAKEKALTATSYTGLPFTVGSLSLAGKGSKATAGFSSGVTRAEEEEQSAKAVDAGRVAVMADITDELQPASKLFRRAAISRVATDADRQQEEDEGSGVEGVERKSSGLVEHEAEEESEKTEVVAKYLFVHGWLRRLLQAAEHVTTAQHTTQLH